MSNHEKFLREATITFLLGFERLFLSDFVLWKLDNAIFLSKSNYSLVQENNVKIQKKLIN